MSAMHLPSRRATLQACIAATLVAGTTVAQATASRLDADAKLIDLCNRIVAIETKIDAVYAGLCTGEDEAKANPQLDALVSQREALFADIEAGPSTSIGAKAVARAYLAVCPKNSRNQPDWEDESGWFAVVLAEFVAAREQAI